MQREWTSFKTIILSNLKRTQERKIPFSNLNWSCNHFSTRKDGSKMNVLKEEEVLKYACLNQSGRIYPFRLGE